MSAENQLAIPAAKRPEGMFAVLGLLDEQWALLYGASSFPGDG
jgi:hypothetical protein